MGILSGQQGGGGAFATLNTRSCLAHRVGGIGPPLPRRPSHGKVGHSRQWRAGVAESSSAFVGLIQERSAPGVLSN